MIIKLDPANITEETCIFSLKHVRSLKLAKRYMLLPLHLLTRRKFCKTLPLFFTLELRRPLHDVLLLSSPSQNTPVSSPSRSPPRLFPIKLPSPSLPLPSPRSGHLRRRTPVASHPHAPLPHLPLFFVTLPSQQPRHKNGNTGSGDWEPQFGGREPRSGGREAGSGGFRRGGGGAWTAAATARGGGEGAAKEEEGLRDPEAATRRGGGAAPQGSDEEEEHRLSPHSDKPNENHCNFCNSKDVTIKCYF